MKASLKAQGVSNMGVNEVLELVKGEHFQVRFFSQGEKITAIFRLLVEGILS